MDDKLKEIVEYSYNHCEYYKNNYVENIDEEFSNIPILYKKDMQDFSEQLLSDKYDGGKRKNLRVERTSGSTGKFTKIYWNRDEFNASNLSLWRLRYKWYGILPHSKCVTFNSVTFMGDKIHKPQKIQVLGKNILGLSKFHLDNEDLEEYCKKINEFKPEWMLVQTSILKRLTEYLKEKKLYSFKSLKYIELNGEMTLDSEKKYFSEFYKIPIADMYGAAEVNGIAYECPYGRKHVLEDNVYLESINIDGADTAIVTSLHNHAMPIIRYNLGDRISIKSNQVCRCGLNTAYLDTIQGRTSDKIILSNGKYISPYVILYCIEKINEVMYYSILQFKIIQKEIDMVEIYLLFRKDEDVWINQTLEELKTLIKQNCSELQVTISQRSQINYYGTEKYKFFENRIK